MHRVLIITPIYPPAVGGAANYSFGLKQYLDSKSIEAYIFTEKMSECPHDDKIFRLIPQRYSRKRGLLLDIFLYVIQNIVYLSIFNLVIKGKVDTILLHSSFLYFPNILHLIIKLIKIYKKEINIIVDIRDNKFHRQLSKIDKISDKIITCSLAALKDIKNHDINDKVYYLPVPLDIKNILEIKSKYKQGSKKIVFWSGIIGGAKNFFDTYEALRKSKYQNHEIIVSGYVKKNSERRFFHLLETDKNLTYVGPISHHENLKLLSRSDLMVFISKSEGVPRICLEASYLAKKNIFPNEIEELKKICPEAVFSGSTVSDLIKKLNEVFANSQNINFAELDEFEEYKVFAKLEKLIND